MGKIDMRVKITKLEKTEAVKVGNYWERTLHFWNGDVCVASITTKAENKDDLILMPKSS